MQPRWLQRAAWGPLRGSACCAGTSACASPSPPSAPRHAALPSDPGITSVSLSIQTACKDRLSFRGHAGCAKHEHVLEQPL